MIKQIIRINKSDETVDLEADRYTILNEEYAFYNGETEVKRVPIDEIVSTEESGGIETIFSRS